MADDDREREFRAAARRRLRHAVTTLQRSGEHVMLVMIQDVADLLADLDEADARLH